MEIGSGVMEIGNSMKQMMNFQKSIFENSFKAGCIVQDHTENLLNGFLDQSPWVTAEGKKFFKESMTFGKKIRDEFKKEVDDGYTRFNESFLKDQKE